MYNILICDDEKDIVAALKIYLEAEGDGDLFKAASDFAAKYRQNTEISPLAAKPAAKGAFIIDFAKESVILFLSRKERIK